LACHLSAHGNYLLTTHALATRCYSLVLANFFRL
jgi:hypothetical protein